MRGTTDRLATSLSATPQSLIDRVRAGDRNAAAEFVLVHGPRIRWRVRHQLGTRMRRVFDSQEILSTVARRLDQYLCNQTLSSISRERLWALVIRITRNAVADKVRIQQRFNKAEDADRDLGDALRSGIEEAERSGDTDGCNFIASALSVVSDQTDRAILNMWLNDLTAEEIGFTLGMSGKAVEWRWRRIKARLREFASGRASS